MSIVSKQKVIKRWNVKGCQFRLTRYITEGSPAQSFQLDIDSSDARQAQRYTMHTKSLLDSVMAASKLNGDIAIMNSPTDAGKWLLINIKGRTDRGDSARNSPSEALGDAAEKRMVDALEKATDLGTRMVFQDAITRTIGELPEDKVNEKIIGTWMAQGCKITGSRYYGGLLPEETFTFTLTEATPATRASYSHKVMGLAAGLLNGNKEKANIERKVRSYPLRDEAYQVLVEVTGLAKKRPDETSRTMLELGDVAEKRFKKYFAIATDKAHADLDAGRNEALTQFNRPKTEVKSVTFLQPNSRLTPEEDKAISKACKKAYLNHLPDAVKTEGLRGYKDYKGASYISYGRLAEKAVHTTNALLTARRGDAEVGFNIKERADLHEALRVRAIEQVDFYEYDGKIPSHADFAIAVADELVGKIDEIIQKSRGRSA